MKNRKFVLIIALFCCNQAWSGDRADGITHEHTMCRSDEQIYFSCPVGQKIVSVCALGNYSPETGYVKYRFGDAGASEFEFPSTPIAPKRVFTVSDSHGGNVNTTLIKFKSGAYTYVVFQSAVSGVYVKKNGRTIRSLLCDTGQYGYISSGAKRGIKTVAADKND